MNENIAKRNRLLSEKIIKGLESRNMTGYYAEDKEEAKRIALSLIEKGSSVTNGGAESAREIGLLDALSDGDYEYINRENCEDKRKAALMAYDADYYIAGANAISEDGVLVNI
ncbi:MAG: LUD domain-containing protein, partial [Lachnospiraceae bacterium]|nr:LUD domain-containing protein [Lachnospiraceae bacterium]